MSIQRDSQGRRSVRVEVEVPGTPEQVWQAIATGPGISAWFVPAQVEPRKGGKMTFDFGGGAVSSSELTAYDPPFRLTADSPGWAPGMPSLATEWTVEAKAGGVCVVRVVHSLFASTDDWDDQLESVEHGWPAYFRILRRYLQHFAGQASGMAQAMAMSKQPIDRVWTTVAAALGMAKVAPGQAFSVAVSPSLTLAGRVESVTAKDTGQSLFATLEKPGPGTLLAGAFACGGVMASLQAFVYGPRAGAVAEGMRVPLSGWFAGRFPADKE